MAAIISGTVLASLFYDHSCAEGGLEGLLYGKVTQRVKDTISDSQINNIKVETKTNIYSYYRSDKSRKFYDRACRIDTQLIHGVTPEGSQVIGWFRFRPNTSPYPSLKEQNIHNNFLAILPSSQQANFIFLLCTGSPFENLSTHNFDFDVLKSSERSKQLVNVPLTVLNLGDTTHSEYKYEGTATVYNGSGRLAKVIEKHKPGVLDEDEQPNEVNKIRSLANDLQSQLEGLTDSVASSENKLTRLKRDLQKQQKILQDKLESKRKAEIKVLAEKESDITITKSVEHKKKEKSGVAHTIRLPSDSSHSRRLGSNEDAQSDHSPTPHYSRKLSTDYEFPSLEAMEVDIPQKSSLVDLTEDKILDPSPETNVKTEESNTQYDPSEPSKKTEISMDRSTGTKPQTVEKPQNSDPFSFVEGFLAQEKSAIPKTNSSKKPTKAEITAKKTNGHKEMSQSPSAINSKETRSGRNTTKNKPAQSLSDTANQRVTRGQRSRSRENKVTQDDSSSNKNNSSLPGKCAMEVNGEVTVVLSDSSDEGLNRRTKEEEFEISSSPVY
uniref:BRISC complex subunit Abraxas 2-like n=1 Tax=Crassostrea virginica TaxID=6565 RepID=A0A8B8AEZ0_CRAVI|nr:BRISC complex subunit Abraxas 2-like [Crassostrea virginica]